jgi:hypothetical protein
MLGKYAPQRTILDNDFCLEVHEGRAQPAAIWNGRDLWCFFETTEAAIVWAKAQGRRLLIGRRLG